MGDNRQIVLDADDKRIATYGLVGCTAVCALAEKDGNWVGYIQHYSSKQRGESMRALEHFRNSVSGDIGAALFYSNDCAGFKVNVDFCSGIYGFLNCLFYVFFF